MRRHLGANPEGAIDAADRETKDLWRQYQNLLQAGFLLLTDLKNGQPKDGDEIDRWVKKEKEYLRLINERREAAKAAGAPTAMHNLLSNTGSGLLMNIEYALLHEKEVDEIWREVDESGQIA